MLVNLDEDLSRVGAWVYYKLPHQDTIHIIISEHAPLVADSFVQINDFEGFVIAPFALTSDTPLILIHGKEQVVRLDDLALPMIFSYDPLEKNVQAEFAAYQKDFSTFIEALHCDMYKKLVLARKHTVELDRPFEADDLFVKACHAYPEAFVYQFGTEYTGIWMGATPEPLLVRGGDGSCHTVSLAGTVELMDDDLKSRKNTLEQAVVTDYISDILTEFGISFQRSDPYSFATAHLKHLKTDFTFRFPNSMPLHQLIEALYPTPAVCGLPKEQAKQFILDHESMDRSYYAGFLGPKKQGEINFYVNLRCLQSAPNSPQIHMYAGGGLLKSSNLNDEWMETNDKINTLLSLIK
ncbi:chorismate-binding protein [Porphyromonadaceae bacterium W3.11]|nr:chorismate-binding protein [Porphyromonadaceae bacterium W3.11]